MRKKKSFKWILCTGLTALGILFLTSCSKSSTPDIPPTTQTFPSSAVLGHTHSITISKSDIDSPPAAGIALTTTASGTHSHSFAMTSDQLLSVAGGSTVTVVSGFADGGAGAHTHSFSIKKWY